MRWRCGACIEFCAKASDRDGQIKSRINHPLVKESDLYLFDRH
jgi:hypothetical protein